MENATKILFSAVTHTGAACTANSDRVFANGRFTYHGAADHSQVSLEISEDKCFFALSENMEDEESGVSITNDLRKFHKKIMASSKDIYVKLDDLVQCVEQSGNLLYSLSFGDNNFNGGKPSFAGILVDNGGIAAVNMGNCRIYKLEGDTFKLLVNDYKRAERLLKMGIISKEQAEMLSSRQKAAPDEGKSTVKKSDVNPLKEGVVYLVCSSGLVEAVNEDKIYDILASCEDPDEAANRLVMEAMEGEAEKCATAMVIKVEGVQADEAGVPGMKPAGYRQAAERGFARQGRTVAARRERTIDAGRVISVVILVFLFAAVVLGGYKLWMMIRTPEAENATSGEEYTLAGSNGQEGYTSGEGTGVGTDDEIEPGISDTTSGSAIETGAGEGGSETGTGPDVTPGEDLLGDEGIEYVVKPGDMLMAIAKKYYGNESYYQLIMKENNIQDPDKIYAGQKLKLPPRE